MDILRWNIDSELRREAEENYRTAYALRLEGRPALDIVRELTLDGSAPRITIADLERLVSWIQTSFLKRPLSGIGIELGAGPLVFSSVLARQSSITRIYGVEVCAPIIERLYPSVARGIAGDAAVKTVGVVGSFDALELSNASVDFAFDFFSLHHSLNITTTLCEVARVLKPGGILLMLDKARPDHYDQADLDGLMDAVYGPGHYRQFGLDASKPMTRRENGEREYRLADWRTALAAAGFGRVDHWHLAKPSGGGLPARIVKTLVSFIPPRLQPSLTRFLPIPKARHMFVLESRDRVFARPLMPLHKEASLIIAYR
jgi:SAM-dependent methyltransferase